MTASQPDPDLVRLLKGERLERPPVWLMRQAGRFLPEYRELRAQAPDFIGFCLSPQMASEATLQPMRRFPLDAAIVFADILLIPLALGQKVWFAAGEGPRLGPLPDNAALRLCMDEVTGLLAPVGETLCLVREQLEPERALIGFAGAPWTVATYMIEGGGSPDKAKARALAYGEPERVDELLEIIVDATVKYLKLQAMSGAQVLQLFESWAEGLPEDQFDRLVVRPHARIVQALRAGGFDLPIIGFPRGAGALVRNYAAGVQVQAIGLDTQASAALGRRVQENGMAIQGALDPLLLRRGGDAMEARIDQLIEQWSGGRHIFNLGHGVLPDTPVEHVAQLVRRVKGG
jgi:uroporphyrinogen decarboxylase